MSLPEDNRPDASEPEAPKRLKDDLASLYHVEVPVPREVDDRILALAREKLAPAKPRRVLVLRRILAASAAAAAVILLVLWLVPQLSRQVKLHSEKPVAAIDLNGPVSILDAFALARDIESNRKPDPRWDVNGDGVVDERDVTIIAHAAVSLSRAEPKDLNGGTIR